MTTTTHSPSATHSPSDAVHDTEPSTHSTHVRSRRVAVVIAVAVTVAVAAGAAAASWRSTTEVSRAQVHLTGDHGLAIALGGAAQATPRPPTQFDPGLALVLGEDHPVSASQDVDADDDIRPVSPDAYSPTWRW